MGAHNGLLRGTNAAGYRAACLICILSWPNLLVKAVNAYLDNSYQGYKGPECCKDGTPEESCVCTRTDPTYWGYAARFIILIGILFALFMVMRVLVRRIYARGNLPKYLKCCIPLLGIRSQTERDRRRQAILDAMQQDAAVERKSLDLSHLEQLKVYMYAPEDDALDKAPDVEAPPAQDCDDCDAMCCAVCLEGFATGEMVCELRCKHTFHELCIMPWLLRRGILAGCPQCRTPAFVVPDPEEDRVADLGGEEGVELIAVTADFSQASATSRQTEGAGVSLPLAPLAQHSRVVEAEEGTSSDLELAAAVSPLQVVVAANFAADMSEAESTTPRHRLEQRAAQG